MTALNDYLNEHGRFGAWGQADCCTFVAGWVMLRGWGDPMAFIRGRYTTERGARRQMVRGGGLVPLWTRGMIEAGPIPEPDEPRAGDVGVVRILTLCGMNQAAGICLGRRWATLGLVGLDVAECEPLRVWRV